MELRYHINCRKALRQYRLNESCQVRKEAALSSVRYVS